MLAGLILLSVACGVPQAPTLAPYPMPSVPLHEQLSQSLAKCVFNNPAMHSTFEEAMVIAKNPSALAMLIDLAIETGETTEDAVWTALVACIEIE